MRLVLGVIALALMGLLFVQWRDWSPTPSIPSVQPGGQAEQAVASDDQEAADLLPPPSRDDYVSVTERPLFLPDRRPPPEIPEEEEASTEDEAPADLDAMDLSAVLITPEVVSAWVRSPSADGLLRLRIGQELEGWTVDDIRRDRLVLKRQGETHELLLRDYENAPPPIAPTPIRQRGATRGRPAPGESAGQPAEDRTARQGRPPTRQRTTEPQQADASPPPRRSAP